MFKYMPTIHKILTTTALCLAAVGVSSSAEESRAIATLPETFSD